MTKRVSFIKEDYMIWKKNSLKDSGYFILFNGFLETNALKDISGGALKLYLFLGLKSNNKTGESFYKIESMSEYFNVSDRTISNWIKELVDRNLIYRVQMEYNSVTHTFLKPYFAGKRGKK